MFSFAFCLFWALMFSIYKQREMGRKISDLEYLYEKYKNKYNIIFTKTSQLDLEFTIDEDILFGESKLGKMYLYKLFQVAGYYVFLLLSDVILLTMFVRSILA